MYVYVCVRSIVLLFVCFFLTFGSPSLTSDHGMSYNESTIEKEAYSKEEQISHLILSSEGSKTDRPRFIFEFLLLCY